MDANARGLCLAAVAALGAAQALAGDAMEPGALKLEAPTVICLGVRWEVKGDANRNARVEVDYRIKGEPEWRKGLPLMRVDPRAIAYGRKTPDMFGGTIFDLRPGTEYEVRLKMSDPDGGEAEKTVTMKTRPVPKAPTDAQVVKVEPQGLAAAARSAAPGTIILVSAGTLKGRLNLQNKKASAARPIVIRAAEEQKVILDAGGGGDVVNLCGAEHIYLEGLVLTNGKNGVNAQGAKGLVVRRCRIEKCRQGFNNADDRRPGRDFYISDNVIIGPYKWPFMKIMSEEGVQVCGWGHVVCHNRIRGWSDGISIVDHRGDPYPCRAFDFYNNDISEATDDGIEMDTGEYNIRAFRNRITDCHAGITNQPVYGGPSYLIRNVMYNIAASPFKMHNKPSGLVIIHNTVVRNAEGAKGGRAALLHYTSSPVRNAYFRNNLFICNGARAIESWGSFVGCDLDYNGYNKGEIAFTKDGAKYKGTSLKDFSEKTGFEKHSRVVDISVFAGDVKFPAVTEKHEPPDLRPKPGGAAIDGGEALPNIGDGFRGEAPDLGAYELDQELPHYGPRAEGMDELTVYEKRRAELAARKDPAPAAGGAAGAQGPAVAKVEGVTPEQLAAALKRHGELKAAIIKGVSEGRRARVYVDMAGRPTRSRVIGADDVAVKVSARGLEVMVKWSELTAERFYGIARRYSRDRQALYEYCLGSGLKDEAEREKPRR